VGRAGRAEGAGGAPTGARPLPFDLSTDDKHV